MMARVSYGNGRAGPTIGRASVFTLIRKKENQMDWKGHRRFLAASLILACAGFYLPSGNLSAQAANDTVVFVHGLFETGSSWNALAGDLAVRHSIFPVKPTMPSADEYTLQATSLAGQ